MWEINHFVLPVLSFLIITILYSGLFCFVFLSLVFEPDPIFAAESTDDGILSLAYYNSIMVHGLTESFEKLTSSLNRTGAMSA